jgi:hypothetical protein
MRVKAEEAYPLWLPLGRGRDPFVFPLREGKGFLPFSKGRLGGVRVKAECSGFPFSLLREALRRSTARERRRGWRWRQRRREMRDI